MGECSYLLGIGEGFVKFFSCGMEFFVIGYGCGVYDVFGIGLGGCGSSFGGLGVGWGVVFGGCEVVGWV